MKFLWLNTRKIFIFINNFWIRYLNKIKIQYKILGLLVGIVLLLSSMLILQMGNILTTNLRDQLDKRAISIGSDVAARSTNELLINNAYSVYEMIKDTVNNNQDVLYIFVVDTQGQVIAHTFAEAFPTELLKANSIQSSGKYNLSTFRTEVGVVHDVAVPILDGKLGTVRVGMDEVGLRKAVYEMIWGFVGTALFVIAIGIIAVFFLTRILTGPIRELVSLTQRVASGDLTVQGCVHSLDEVGQLTQAFNQMTVSLNENNTEREGLLRQLKEKEEMRLHLLDKLMSAQEDERKRISRELHDETSQSLSSLMVGLKVLESEASVCSVGNRLQEMRQVVSQTLDEIHHMARELRPSVLDDMGLVPALERYVRDYQQKYGIDVDFHKTGIGDERISASAEVALYRIIQEALTNVAKYAQANAVSVILDWRDDWVSAIVEDDGVGFEPEKITTSPSHGLGLFGMQERAALLGGSFKIESQIGFGTTVFIRIPAKHGFDD